MMLGLNSLICSMKNFIFCCMSIIDLCILANWSSQLGTMVSILFEFGLAITKTKPPPIKTSVKFFGSFLLYSQLRIHKYILIWSAKLQWCNFALLSYAIYLQNNPNVKILEHHWCAVERHYDAQVKNCLWRLEKKWSL